MSGPFGSSQWMYSSGAAFYPFAIDQSLRFNDNDSAYLSRTPASAGNRKTWTWSGWVKRGNLGIATNFMIEANSGDGFNRSYNYFSASDEIVVGDYTTSWQWQFKTNAVFRDASAWYHIVIAFDSTQATSTDRFSMYVNGEKVTSFATATYPSLNKDSYVNSTLQHTIGYIGYAGQRYLDGYLAEVNFIDGQALDPTSFGEFKSGVWIPKDPSGLTYGTNGFRLSFADSSNIGDDTSGNTNDWTANSLVATDVLSDSPTNNFAVMNPLWKSSNTVLEEGNLYLPSRSYYSNAVGTIGVSSGKWYFEARVGNNYGSYYEFGVIATDDKTFINQLTSALRGNVSWSQLNKIYNNGTLVTNPTSPNLYNTSTKIVGCAVDLDNNKVYFHGNGTWLNSSDPDTNTGGTTIAAAIQGKTFVPLVGTNNVSASPNTWVNFGQDGTFAGTETAQGNTDDNGIGDFYYAPPSGYLALCTANLPDPVIDPAQDDVPSDYFNTVLYTGTGATNNVVSGVGFQSDFTWIKDRSAANFHSLHDAVRGVGQALQTNNTSSEFSYSDYFGPFNSDGFTVAPVLSGSNYNTNGNSYVAWNWLAGNGTSSNTDGSITSTVSVNQKAGFSIVSYTGTGSAATVGHGLGAKPSMIIIKNRSTAAAWDVYHTSTTASQYLTLNATSAAASSAWMQNTEPTSSVFYLGGGGYGANLSGDNTIAYCFAEIPSYSSFGKYTGNGSTDGPFIYTGFEVAWLVVKRTDSAESWVVEDAKREPYNDGISNRLILNLSDAEYSDAYPTDFLSNGFKHRNTGTSKNASGGTYIYMAFAENPFKYANAR